MNFAVLASEKDLAGMNIFKHIHTDFPSLNHYLIQEESIYAENIDKQDYLKNYDFFIFATRHQSKEKRKTFSIHAPGNWKKADFGGKEGEICKTSAFFLKHLFITLEKEAKKASSDYEITLEATHHGPFLEKPCCFIEIGTRKENWQDEKAGEIIARTIKKAVDSFGEREAEKKWKVAIGIGGPHYAPNFNKIQLNSNYALSHITPSYVFPLTLETLKQAVEKTKEKVELAILDWKGMKSKEREEAIKLLNLIGLRYLRTSEAK